MSSSTAAFRVSIIYRVIFLFIEPVSALVEAFYSHFRQHRYLELLDAASTPEQVPLGTSVALSQLANMHLFFAINEAIVLRSTADLTVWRTVLAGLLIADVGRLLAMGKLGGEIYFEFMNWNVSDLGNILWVYLGFTLRMSFLVGIGLGEDQALTKEEDGKKKQ